MSIRLQKSKIYVIMFFVLIQKILKDVQSVKNYTAKTTKKIIYVLKIRGSGIELCFYQVSF